MFNILCFMIYYFVNICHGLSTEYKSPCNNSEIMSMCINNIRFENTTSEYTYFPDELVQVECWPGHAENGTKVEEVAIKFRNKGNVIYSTSHVHGGKQSMMQVKLTAELEGAFLECYCYSLRHKAIKVKLIPDKEQFNLTLQINGLLCHLRRCLHFMNARNELLNLTVSTHNEHSFITFDDDNAAFNYTYSPEQLLQYNLQTNARGTDPSLTPYPLAIRQCSTNETVTVKLETVTGELCFDPYFTLLDENKILARYKHYKKNMIKYQLDFEEDIVNFGCMSVSGKGVITVNRIKSPISGKLYKLYTKNERAFIEVTCVLHEDGQEKTTVLYLTRKMKRNETKAQNTTIVARTPRLIRKDEIDITTEEVSTTYLNKDLIILVSSNVITMILTAMISIILVKVFCQRAQHTPVQSTAQELISQDDRARNEPEYEPIVYSACKSGYKQPVVEIVSRDPHPLPPEAAEESQKYIHYDTVYEERLQRMLNMRKFARPRNT